VPWCPTCDRFLSPPTVNADGTCPTCGRPVEAAPPSDPEARERRRAATLPPPEEEEELPHVPGHLKVLGVATVFYLGWRLVQGVEWLIHRIR